MNFDNEQMLIGSLILKPDNFFAVAEIVTEEDFASKPALVSFRAIREMIAAKKPINIASLFHVTGDPSWVGNATDVPGIVASHKHLAEKVAEQAKGRRIEQKMGKAKNALRDFGTDIALQEIQQIYKDEVGGRVKSGEISVVGGRFRAVVSENKKRGRVGVDTGFYNLKKDYITYQQGHLWVVGAWTSTGKTAWMIEAIKRIYENGNPCVAIFSTEMTEEQNVGRVLANVTAISSHQILAGNVSHEFSERIDKGLHWLESRNLHLFDQIRTVDGIENQCRKIAMQSGSIDVVFIDFIQNIGKKGCSSKYEMMSEIALDLQALAKELRCCVVCLSQIPNSAGKEDAGILEFKGAGEIAAAADLGVLLTKHKTEPGVILWESRKNRHGACGKFLLQYSDGYTRMEEI